MRFLNKQSGFTLIELMISIVLGLLISSAAIALFLGSSRNLRIQEASDDAQEAEVFSLNYIQREIAMSNLGAFSPATQVSAWTGIVLTSSIDHSTEVIEGTTDPRQIGNLRGVGLSSGSSTTLSDIPSNLLSTNTVVDTQDTLNSNVSIVSGGAKGARSNSDQITIQYEAPFAMQDCEGTNRNKGDIIVERFFTRQDNVTAGMSEPYSIAIACDAGVYRLVNGTNEVNLNQIKKNTFALDNFGDAGEILVNRVDVFKIKLGIMLDNGIKYMDIDEYMTVDTSNTSGYKYEGPIVAVKMGVIARGVNPIGTQTPIRFNVLGENYEITTDTTKYARRVYESTIYLRNGVI